MENHFFVQCDITIRLSNLLSFPLSNFSTKRMKSGGALIFLGIKFHIDVLYTDWPSVWNSFCFQLCSCFNACRASPGVLQDAFFLLSGKCHLWLGIVHIHMQGGWGVLSNFDFFCIFGQSLMGFFFWPEVRGSNFFIFRLTSYVNEETLWCE